MRGAGMLRVLCKQPPQNLSGLPLVGIGSVSRWGGSLQGERVIDADFVVLRIALRHPLHGVRVGQKPGAEGHLVVVTVTRVDPVTIACGLCPTARALTRISDPAWASRCGGGPARELPSRFTAIPQ